MGNLEVELKGCARWANALSSPVSCSCWPFWSMRCRDAAELNLAERNSDGFLSSLVV